MQRYYVNKNAQSGGEHEVHTTGCPTPPNLENRVSLGEHASCRTAVVKAREIYANVDGCKHCCLACHTR